MRPQAWLLEGLVLVLTLANCWYALTTKHRCDYGCLKVVGPADCNAIVQSAREYHGDPDCLGVGKCRPYGEIKKHLIRHEDKIYDDCKAPDGQIHRQHVTTIEWDSDLDGVADTVCAARHSCPKVSTAQEGE